MSTKTLTFNLGEIFHRAANESLRLSASEDYPIKTKNYIKPEDILCLRQDNYNSPYTCDAIVEAVGTIARERIKDCRLLVDNEDIWRIEEKRIQPILKLEGMEYLGTRVWHHISASRRQEARYFWLMLLSHKYEGKTIKAKIDVAAL